MYDRIEIDGYRRFEHFVFDGLTRVNLIVGKNNAGKTSLLEAIEVVTGPAAPEVVFASCKRRKEFERREPLSPEQRSYRVDLSHLFFGHEIREGSAFSISTHGADATRLRLALTSGVPSNAGGAVHPVVPESPIGVDIVLHANGEMHIWSSARALDPDAKWQRTPSTPFVSTTAERDDLANLWSGVVLTEEEDRVVKALRSIEPRVERVAIANEGEHDIAYVRVNGRRLPLSSFGDGMFRVLRLALHLAKAAGRVLLVDEIDTGLHHTVLRDVWKMIIEGAQRLDVQVFATTHSHDCLMALAYLTQLEPGLAQDVSVHRIEAGADRTVNMDAEDLAAILEHKIEVR